MRTQRADLGRRADALLDAAVALLVSGRSSRIRIEDVAARAGVGKGTVYLHWAGRDQLLLAVGAREAASMLDVVVDAVRAEPTEAAPHRYLRRHFLEAMRRPVLAVLFGASDRDAFARERERSELLRSKGIAAREYLGVLAEHRLLRAGIDLADVDYGIQAVAYGFFASEPLQPGRTLEYRADQLAGVVRRAYEPAEAPAAERYLAAAPEVVAAFTKLADAFRRTAYGPAADLEEGHPMADITGIHHIGLIVRDMDAALNAYRRLGFHVGPPAFPALPRTPGEPPEPVGAGNTHADFPRSFIELLALAPERNRLPADAVLVPLSVPDDQLDATRAVITRTVANLAARLDVAEGAHILVFATRDADATAARWEAEGIGHSGVRAAQRPLATAEGTVLADVRFLDVDETAGMVPEGRVGVAEDAPAELLDAQQGLVHPNGATGLAEVVICLEDSRFRSAVERYERYLDRSPSLEKRTAAFDLGASRVTLTTPAGLAERLPGEVPHAVPGLSACTVEVADLSLAEDHLRSEGVALRRSADGDLFIPGVEALGTSIMLRQSRR
ncbi:transcriptional regulator, TetR family [Glycomyces harbinensis]|uniref:Transcriptional regulator, TetR family n=2 Tax=Glycomyces harbinensis TaxID=58114 RepID=A0A1G6ZSN8_9ACTN|nr:transcriptional regulator, TetR family [Glycomyces harbinensis]